VAAVKNSMIEPFLMGYLLAINILAFCVMDFDKQKARKGVWRISESTLFTLAILGGSIGDLLGMWIFRHKTKHLKFVIGMPFILIIQLVITYIIYSYSISIN
jgi:uncharacterized membrane protein YsdA (DUF1294 family)